MKRRSSPSACGPVLNFAFCFVPGVERGKGAPGRAGACDARRSPQAATSLRCSLAWPCRPTRFAARSSRAAARQAEPGLRPVGGGEQRRAGVGARSALRCLTRHRLSERSERSERSELGDATPDRAAQRSRRTAPTATVWPQLRLRLPRFARPSARSGRQRSAKGRKQTFNPQRFVHRGSRESRWSK